MFYSKIISRTIYLPKQKQIAGMVQQKGGSFVQHQIVVAFFQYEVYSLFQEVFYLTDAFLTLRLGR